ncbi:hypothetical protein NHQ30_000269 [Ciborinia camelliae]|nr:hypothetical protein NHQ30_000269 [Ciborinia camelliae]
MLLSIPKILQTVIFSTLVSSFAVPDPTRNIVAKAIALQGECTQQGGLCAHVPCCKNSGLTCRVDGHGMHFCEFGNPSPRSTLSTFHEIFQKFRETASPNLGSFPIPPRHQSDKEFIDEDETVIVQNEERIDMNLDNHLKLGDGVIATQDTCSEVGSSCDFHKDEHCCPSLVCYTARGSDISECRFPVDGISEDEQMEHKKESKKEGVNKWDFLEVIEIPPRLDDITELPKCKSINMKCNPISGIHVCCPDLTCMQVGPPFEDFECKKALSGDGNEKKKVTAWAYEEGENGGNLQWFLDGWKDQKPKDSESATEGRNEGSERIDDDEVVSL